VAKAEQGDEYAPARGTLLEIAQVRLGLISTKLELEKRRWITQTR
jgi:hypothetical protein